MAERPSGRDPAGGRPGLGLSGPPVQTRHHSARQDETARLREYVPGDRFSRVSWSATARTGQLFVTDHGPGDQEILVVLDLGPPGLPMTTTRFTLDNAAQDSPNSHPRLLVTTGPDGISHLGGWRVSSVTHLEKARSPRSTGSGLGWPWPSPSP
ncbi:MAG: DUF58 domain-containing protein [Actinomycetia bacterium]|nr:DUF58 domain-containing protein [Actinomycetes bacterium]